MVSGGPDIGNRYVTTYFRHTFDIESLADLEDFGLRVQRDDGVAVYVNGVEVARELLPSDAAYDTLALSGASDDGVTWRGFKIPDSLLHEGQNVLAAEIHQATPNSSDISFDASVLAVMQPSSALPGVLVNDHDVDNLPLRAELITPPDHGTLTLHADGTFAYLPQRTFVGTDRFEYQATDDFGNASVTTASIQVQPANVPPLAADDHYLIGYRATLGIGVAQGVLTNDSDLEPGPLTARLIEGPAYGQLNLRPDGSFTYIPGASFTLSDRFSYFADDGQLQSDPVQVYIELDAPTIIVGTHLLKPNLAGQSLPVYVTGGQLVSGVNLFVQIGDGGPELSDLGLPPGVDGPAVTGIDLKNGTLFQNVVDPPFVELTVPQVAFAAIAITAPNEQVTANGLLATLTVDTTGLFGGVFALQLDQVLPMLGDGPFATDFGGLPIHITNGSLEVISAQIEGRHVFYNNSKFDNENPESDSGDDRAIAPDKQALLPGNTATFGNYTNYSRGLNGVMIDVKNLLGQVSLADFSFKVGNNSNTTSWAPAPAPRSLTVRPGAGDQGSDRLTIIWDDGVLQNKWLQVTMLSNEQTGLVKDDVFYFGNAIGESGDAAANALVNASDVVAARDNPRGPFNLADITNPFDFNRDRLVTAVDVILARDHITSPLTALRLITTPAGPAAALAAATTAVGSPESWDANQDRVFEEEADWWNLDAISTETHNQKTLVRHAARVFVA